MSTKPKPVNDTVAEAKPIPENLAENILKVENLMARARMIKAAAKEYGISAESIKAEVARLQKAEAKPEAEDKIVAHWAGEPWPYKVDGAKLFDDICTRIESHLVMSKNALMISAAWAMFTWFHDECVHSPMFVTTSPAPECGKSTLLGLLKYLTRRGFLVSNTTSAPVYRAVEAWHPTLLLDEADRTFRRDPELGQIFNSGWTRGSGVLRCHPETLEPENFDTFTPKAIGLIGLRMEHATISRSIVIRLERKLPDQACADFLHIDDDKLARLRAKLSRFAADNAVAFREAKPAGVEGFANRLWANWRPLLAIADLCGKGEDLRKAAAATATRADAQTLGVIMIGDMISIMEKRGADGLHSDDIIPDLHAMEDRPWNEWGMKIKKPISKHQLASLLKPFEIAPGQVWVGSKNLRGYKLDDLKAANARYGAKPSDTPAEAEEAPPGVIQSARPLDPLLDKGLRGIQSARGENGLALWKTLNPLRDKASSTLALQNAPPGGSVCPACAEDGWTQCGHVVGGTAS
jgi:putative DNA primase/helicase